MAYIPPCRIYHSECSDEGDCTYCTELSTSGIAACKDIAVPYTANVKGDLNVRGKHPKFLLQRKEGSGDQQVVGGQASVSCSIIRVLDFKSIAGLPTILEFKPAALESLYCLCGENQLLVR